MSDSETSPRISREILAGITTFASMAYILVVNPDMLAITGMDRAALVTATALAAAAGSFLMASMTGYPISLAPGMGLNAFFTFTICGQLEVPWQGALAMVFWTGILFLVLSLTRFRESVVESIPDPLKIGIQAGIGLFIFVIGLKNLGLFTDPAPHFPALRPADPAGIPIVPLLLAAFGCLVVILLRKKKVAGAILYAIVLATVAGLFLKSGGKPITESPDSVVSLPPSLSPVFLQVDWLYPFRHWETLWVAMLTLFFVDLFDSIGTLIGVTERARLVDESGRLPKMKQALAADAGATSIGACFGVSTTTAYIESATGVEAGGRTGLTSVVAGSCFLLALFFYPLLAVIPAAAVAPALLVVGVLMLQNLGKLKKTSWQALVAAIAIVVLIPLNFQIAEGIAGGCVVYTILMVLSGRAKEIHWFLAVLSILFAVRFVSDFVN